MLGVLRGLALGCGLLSLAQMASASEVLYRCSDGTFTNRAERQCQPYQAKGIVWVQGEAAKGDNAKEPFAEVKVFDEPAKAAGREYVSEPGRQKIAAGADSKP